MASLGFVNSGSTSESYILIVASASAPQGCGDYEITAFMEACPNDDLFYEDNDTCATAAVLSGPMEFNPQLQLMSSVQFDDDWS